MFLRIALAMSPARFGYTAAFIVNASWIFYASALASVPALLRAAPTKRALERDQEELTAADAIARWLPHSAVPVRGEPTRSYTRMPEG